MTIEKMITKHSVLLDLEVKNKKQLLEDLSKNIASIIEEEEREIFNGTHFELISIIIK